MHVLLTDASIVTMCPVLPRERYAGGCSICMLLGCNICMLGVCIICMLGLCSICIYVPVDLVRHRVMLHIVILGAVLKELF